MYNRPDNDPVRASTAVAMAACTCTGQYVQRSAANCTRGRYADDSDTLRTAQPVKPAEQPMSTTESCTSACVAPQRGEAEYYALLRKQQAQGAPHGEPLRGNRRWGSQSETPNLTARHLSIRLRRRCVAPTERGSAVRGHQRSERGHRRPMRPCEVVCLATNPCGRRSPGGYSAAR